MPLSSEIRFDEQVVIIIDGDSGMGKALAILYGLRGAHVVVNAGCTDLPQKMKAVDLVVEEILNNGGSAVPSYDSMNYPEKIIECAISNFGGIDVLVCDYGSSDRIAYANESWEETFETCYYQIQRLVLSCWTYFKQQRYGRIILATTGDGVVGPLMKPSYVAAKMGIVGLSQVLAKQGRADNILCNAYLTGPSMLLTRKDFPSYPNNGPDMFAQLAPFIFFLTAERCSETGSLFEIGPRNYLKIEKDLVIIDNHSDFLNAKINKTSETTAKTRPLEGLVAFVTGAESSLGLSIAGQLKENGASVVAYKGAPLKTQDSKFSMATAVPSAGFNRLRRSSVNVLHKVKGILKEPKSLADDIRIIANLKPEIALSLAIAEKGGVDILVNCCTTFDELPSKTINPKNWELMLKQSINSAYNLSKEAMPGISERGRGRIINVVPDPNQAGANIIDMSLRGLTKAFQHDRIGFTTIIGADSSSLVSQQISSLVSFLATDNSTFNRMTLEVTEESVYQIGFKHTMGFRIPIINEEELPEDISKHWWQISNSKPSLIVPKRRRSIASGKLENTLRRLSLSG